MSKSRARRRYREALAIAHQAVRSLPLAPFRAAVLYRVCWPRGRGRRMPFYSRFRFRCCCGRDHRPEVLLDHLVYRCPTCGAHFRIEFPTGCPRPAEGWAFRAVARKLAAPPEPDPLLVPEARVNVVLLVTTPDRPGERMN